MKKVGRRSKWKLGRKDEAFEDKNVQILSSNEDEAFVVKEVQILSLRAFWTKKMCARKLADRLRGSVNFDFFELAAIRNRRNALRHINNTRNIRTAIVCLCEVCKVELVRFEKIRMTSV